MTKYKLYNSSKQTFTKTPENLEWDKLFIYLAVIKSNIRWKSIEFLDNGFILNTFSLDSEQAEIISKSLTNNIDETLLINFEIIKTSKYLYKIILKIKKNINKYDADYKKYLEVIQINF